jgi:hypothetical protein
MKKKFQAAWLFLMLILLVGIGGAQAAEATINWDVNSNYDGGNYQVLNAGHLWYWDGSAYYDSNIVANNTKTEGTANQTGSVNYNSESITVSGTAGGSYLESGLTNTVSAEVTQSGDHVYFDQVSQTISSSLKRSFSVEANAEVTVDALLGNIDDLITWALVESGISYSSYTVSASLKVLAGEVSSNDVNVSDLSYETILNEENGYSDTIVFTSNSNVVFYNLVTSLTITTDLSNFDSATGETGITLDVSKIGDLTMVTEVSAVSTPVPGSMFLLFSGFTGLAAILRRRKK